MTMITEVNEQLIIGQQMIQQRLRSRHAAPSSLLVRFLPIIFFTFYLTFTVLLFAFGPWQWPVKNPQELYTFLFLSQVALFFGYAIGALRRPRGYYWTWSYKKLIILSLVLNLLLLLPTSYSRTGTLIPNMIEGLQIQRLSIT
ncbi:MAG: hypothetical protein R3E79_42490 [Caldilineaceae bacterium]